MYNFISNTKMYLINFQGSYNQGIFLIRQKGFFLQVIVTYSCGRLMLCKPK